MREVAHLTHGQVIEVLVANRLFASAPLVRVGDWAREWAVEEVFGIEADLLNDDRIGRALDAVAPELEHIVGTVGANAIVGFGIDVPRLHWDMTSISLHGAYESPEEGFPQVKYGHPKDRRADLKQIQAGIAISADGGIPVFHRAYDGGAGEVSQVVGAMTALRELAAPRDFLMVGDSKLISYGNLLALREAGVRFIAPAPAAKIPDGLFAALDMGQAQPVDYIAGRDAGKPPAQRGHYRVLEDTQTLSGPRKRDPQVTVRRILVHSSANAAAQQAARTRRLEKAREELDRLRSACGGRHYATVQKITARIGVTTSKRRIGSCLVTSISTDEAGRPALTWHYDQEALAAGAEVDGWYALLTILAAADADAAEVLIRYKDQPGIERRHSDFKGPLAVAPVFLHHNQRIAALITVICLALLVFCLIERQVRQALGGDQTMRGLEVCP
ncbi:IS1634 family transposase [Streptomyces sp. NBC_00343]|uniref:IS1634 family transposase n=1 Tax=Streptomyces sp. NBC_00343 TaxID=2975719 RepID=UPI002E280124|nr:IS1634 family transposase [Streptomyces sp. NBC_00343]